jgi:hypothetical protein
MISKVVKVSALIVGITLLGVLALLAFLVFNSGGPKDHLLQQKASPDGRMIAELHANITPMHGGPDTLYVTIRRTGQPFGSEVYSRTYECSDVGAYRLEWEGPNELTIAYGACDSGRWHTKDENKVWKSDVTWEGVRIIYEDTKHVATR